MTTTAGCTVSVIVPVHNAEPYLAETLRSTLSQTWRDLEIIVVDDGSTDDSLGIARKFAGQGVRVLVQPNRGASAARNRGLCEATGRFIQFLDADDLLAPDKVEQQMLELQRQPGGTVANGPWAMFADDIDAANCRPEPVWRDYQDPIEWLVSSWEGGGMMQTACWLTPVEVVRRAGPWDERLSLHDDGEYFCRVLANASGIRFCAGARVYYRQVAGSLSRHRSRHAAESHLAVCDAYRRTLGARGESTRARAALALNYARFLYETHPEHPDLMDSALASLRDLGFDDPPLVGGAKFRSVARWIGMERALGLRALARRLRG